MHLAYVATLPCETLMSAKQAINDKLQGSVAACLSIVGLLITKLRKFYCWVWEWKKIQKLVNIWWLSCALSSSFSSVLARCALSSSFSSVLARCAKCMRLPHFSLTQLQRSHLFWETWPNSDCLNQTSYFKFLFNQPDSRTTRGWIG